jgi:hypothetical protein
MGVVLLLGLGACASGGGAPSGVAPGSPVAVTVVKAVAGRWVGLMDLPGNQEDQYLVVTVQEDGRYEAKAARTIGILDARGTIEVRDGGLLLQGARGSHGTARLFSRDGRPTLMMEMVTPNQERTTARLRPER